MDERAHPVGICERLDEMDEALRQGYGLLSDLRRRRVEGSEAEQALVRALLDEADALGMGMGMALDRLRFYFCLQRPDVKVGAKIG